MSAPPMTSRPAPAGRPPRRLRWPLAGPRLRVRPPCWWAASTRAILFADEMDGQGPAIWTSGAEGLVRLEVRSGGARVVLQAAGFQGLALDPGALGEDGLAAAEADVGGVRLFGLS